MAPNSDDNESVQILTSTSDPAQLQKSSSEQQHSSRANEAVGTSGGGITGSPEVRPVPLHAEGLGAPELSEEDDEEEIENPSFSTCVERLLGPVTPGFTGVAQHFDEICQLEYSEQAVVTNRILANNQAESQLVSIAQATLYRSLIT